MPAVAVAGAVSTNCVAAAALTVIELLVPRSEAFTVSVAVSVWLPAVSRVTVKVPTPSVNVSSAGSTAAVSLLVKATVPV